MNIRKYTLLKDLYKKVKKRRLQYLNKTNKYRRLNTCSDVVISGSGTLATTCLITSLSLVTSPLMIASVLFSSTSTLLTALKRASNIQTKYEQYKTAYLSYSDLERELKLKLSMELNDKDLDLTIADVNDRISLVEVYAPTLSKSESDVSPETGEPSGGLLSRNEV